MTLAAEPMYLARCELGGSCTVVVVDSQVVRLPDHNKPRATILKRKPRVWLFDARRTALGEMLCLPGAAAFAYSADEAKAAAAALLMEKAEVLRATMRMTAQYQTARVKR